MFSKVVVLCGLIAYCLAAVAKVPLPEKPEKFKYYNGCYIPELDVMLAYEARIPSKISCMEYRCTDTYLYYDLCSAVAAREGYKVVSDKDEPYPNCCPRIVLEDSTE